MLNEAHVPIAKSNNEPLPAPVPDVAIHPHPTADEEPALMDAPVLSDPDAVAIPVYPKSHDPEKSVTQKERH